MSLERAARVTSPVQHMSSLARNIYSPAAVVVFGIALGVSAYFTGGLSLVAISGAMGAAGVTVSTGQLLDKYVRPADASEKIAKGVEHVFLEEAKYQAANVSVATLTDQHGESPSTGSESVYIENARASRRYDQTKCNGQILDGAEHIYYGGAALGETAPGDGPPPAWREIIDKTIEYGGIGLGVWGGLTSGMSVLEGLSLAADISSSLGAVPDGPVKDGLFFGKDLYGLKQ